MKLDISKFKKLRTEKDHTVLQHPDGHEIRVLHKPLSPEVRSQLAELPHMAHGKIVGEDQALKPDQRADNFNKARTRGVNILKEQMKHMSDGGNVKLQEARVKNKVPAQQKKEQMPHMAMGGEAIMKENYSDGGLAKSASTFVKKASGQEEPDVESAPQESQEEQYARIREQNTRNMNQSNYADGGSVPKVDPAKGQQISDSFKSAFAKGGGVHLHFYAEGSSQPISSTMSESPAEALQQEVAQNPVQDSAPQQDQNVPQAAPQEAPIAPADINAPPTGTLSEQAIANTEAQNRAEMAGAQNVQQAQGQEANIYGEQAKKMQELSDKYQKIGNDLHQKFEDVSDQVSKAQIDPHHWWNEKSTGSKVLTAIGMMFAGAGAGVSGHPEMAGQAIDAAINRDIDAQKQNINNKNTLLGKYMEMYNNLPQAQAATRLTMEAGVEGMIKQQAAKLGSQNAMLQAQQTIAARRQALLPQMEGLAKGQVMGQMYNDMSKPQAPASNEEQAYQQRMQNMRVLNPDLGKDMENKYLPNVGVARVPVPDKLREELTSRKDLSDKLAQLENFSRQHSGTVLDRAAVNEGTALARNVQDAYRRANAQGVFREAEKDFVEKSIATDPTQFFSGYKAIPGYRTTRKLNDQTVNQFYKSYGIKPFQDSGEQTQTMGGVQYRKVPGGWQKVK